MGNPDLTPHIAILVECMSDPSSVAACMKALASTTFVAEVTAPALALLVPLLLRALNDRSMEVQRRTVVVIDNLVKLVRDPNVAAVHLRGLVDGVEKIMKRAWFPEVSSSGVEAVFALTLERSALLQSQHIILLLRRAPPLRPLLQLLVISHRKWQT